MYLPYLQQDFGFEPEYLVVRTAGDPMRMADAVRQQVWAVDHEQPVAGQLIWHNTLYALFYATMALSAAVLIFERRNLK